MSADSTAITWRHDPTVTERAVGDASQARWAIYAIGRLEPVAQGHAGIYAAAKTQAETELRRRNRQPCQKGQA